MDCYSENSGSLENSFEFDSFLENDLGLNLESSFNLGTPSDKVYDNNETQYSELSNTADKFSELPVFKSSHLLNEAIILDEPRFSIPLPNLNHLPLTDESINKPLSSHNILSSQKEPELDQATFSDAESFYKEPSFKVHNIRKDCLKKLPTQKLYFESEASQVNAHPMSPALFPVTNSVVLSGKSTKASLFFLEPSCVSEVKKEDNFANIRRRAPTVGPQEKPKVVRHRLLPPLPYKTYEEFHQSRLRRQQDCQTKDNIKTLKSQASLGFLKDPSESLREKATLSSRPRSEISSLSSSPLEYNSGMPDRQSFGEDKSIDFFDKIPTAKSTSVKSWLQYSSTEEEPFSRQEETERSNKNIGCSPVASSSVAPVSSPSRSNRSEETSVSSEASPTSENILTDSILNLFQLNSSFTDQELSDMSLKKSQSEELNLINLNQKRLDHTTKGFLFPTKTSDKIHFIPASLSPSLPPKYSVSDKPTIKNDRNTFAYNQLYVKPRPSDSDQVFLDRLDEIIKTQQHCVGLLKEIRDKLPFSEPSVFMTRSPPVSNELLKKIQQLQEQLYLGLNELNLQPPAENNDSFYSTPIKKYNGLFKKPNTK